MTKVQAETGEINIYRPLSTLKTRDCRNLIVARLMFAPQLNSRQNWKVPKNSLEPVPCEPEKSKESKLNSAPHWVHIGPQSTYARR